MKPNGLKKGLELAAVITALVFSAIDLVLEIIGVIQVIQYIEYIESMAATIYISLIIAIGLVTTELILSIKLLAGYSAAKANKSKKGLRIAFLVISSILFFFLTISAISGEANGIAIVGIFVFLTVIVLESIVLALKDQVAIMPVQESVAANTPTTEAAPTMATPTENLTLEQKIMELKHLYELGALTQEQYESAVERIIKQVM